MKLKGQKLIASILAMCIVVCYSFSMTAFASNEEFVTRKDVVEMLLVAADDYNPTVTKSDVIRGYEDGQLREDNLVTKAEALIMVKRAFGNIPSIRGFNKYVAFPKKEFNDVPGWAKAELGDMFELGIVGGNDKGEFSPNDKVTKSQMKTLISRVYRLFGTNKRDDFYAAVNKDALDNATIPDGKAATGTLYNDTVSNLLESMMKELSVKDCEKNSKEYKLKTVYNNYLNKEARNKQGYEPIKQYLEAVDNVKSVSSFVDTEYGRDCLLNIFLRFNVGSDMKNSSQYVNYFQTLSIISKSMFEGKMEPQKEAYLKYIQTLFTLVGENDVDAKKAAQDYYRYMSDAQKN